MIMYSSSAVQQGYGSDPWKHVGHMTLAEKEHVRGGGLVVFQAERLSGPGGRSGTNWRRVIYIPSCGFLPRVATREQVTAAGQKW